MHLVLYYELGYTDNLLAQLNKHRQYKYRNSLVPLDRKEIINIFLNILEKLIYLKEDDPKIDLTKVNLDILNLNNFRFKNWLLEKIEPFNIKRQYRKIKQVL